MAPPSLAHVALMPPAASDDKQQQQQQQQQQNNGHGDDEGSRHEEELSAVAMFQQQQQQAELALYYKEDPLAAPDAADNTTAAHYSSNGSLPFYYYSTTTTGSHSQQQQQPQQFHLSTTTGSSACRHSDCTVPRSNYNNNNNNNNYAASDPPLALPQPRRRAIFGPQIHQQLQQQRAAAPHWHVHHNNNNHHYDVDVNDDDIEQSPLVVLATACQRQQLLPEEEQFDYCSSALYQIDVEQQQRMLSELTPPRSPVSGDMPAWEAASLDQEEGPPENTNHNNNNFYAATTTTTTTTTTTPNNNNNNNRLWTRTTSLSPLTPGSPGRPLVQPKKHKRRKNKKTTTATTTKPHETTHAQSLLLGLAFAAVWSPSNLMAPNLTEMAASFGLVTNADRDLYLGSYCALATGVLSLPLSALIGIGAERVCRKRLLVSTVAAGALCCALTAQCRTYAQLFLLRLLNGGCMSGSVPVAFSFLGDMFAAEERNAASSGLTAMMGLGIILGQVYAGMVGSSGSSSSTTQQGGGWRHAFEVSAVITAVLAGLCALLVRDPVRGGKEKVLQDMIKAGTRYERKLTWEGFLHAVRHNESNAILLWQGFFSSLPWGVIFVFLNDYLSQERGFTVPDATYLVLIFGLGCAAGGVLGGYLGQAVQAVNRSYLPLFMAVTTAAGILPFWGLLNSHFTNAHGFWGLALAGSGGLIASLPSVNVRPCLINVNPPETRGASLTAANLLINLGRGVGPSCVTFLTTIWRADRQFAFNVTVRVLCVVRYAVLAWRYVWNDNLSLVLFCFCASISIVCAIGSGVYHSHSFLCFGAYPPSNCSFWPKRCRKTKMQWRPNWHCMPSRSWRDRILPMREMQSMQSMTRIRLRQIPSLALKIA